MAENPATKAPSAPTSKVNPFWFYLVYCQALGIVVALIGAFLLGHGYSSNTDMAFVIPGYLLTILGIAAVVILAVVDARHKKSLAH